MTPSGPSQPCWQNPPQIGIKAGQDHNNHYNKNEPCGKLFKILKITLYYIKFRRLNGALEHESGKDIFCLLYRAGPDH